MSVAEIICYSGCLGEMIAVPLLREVAAVFLAVSISKDCNARGNGSGALWGIFTLLSPLLAGIIYCAYSRFLSTRKAETPKDKKKEKSSVRFCILAIFTYIISVIMLIYSITVITVSGLSDSFVIN